MSVLNSILEYKARKDAQAQLEAQAIPNALAAFQQGQEKAQLLQQNDRKNLIDEMTVKVNAAKSGLDFDPTTGQLKSNPSLLNAMQSQTGVYSFNPTTGQLEQISSVPKNSIVRNTDTPENVAARETAKSQASYEGTKETAGRAFDLRKEFQSLPMVQDYQVIKNQVAQMDGLLKNIDTDKQSAVALDQGLISTFGKVTDPASTVREAEYNRTPENLSLANRFQGAFEKLKGGGAGLTKEDREALVFGAKVIANTRGKLYNETVSNYEQMSKEFNVDPKLVIMGMGRHTDFENNLNTKTPKQQGNNKVPIVGEQFQGGTVLRIRKIK